MTQERAGRLAKYFTDEPKPCQRYEKDAMCRSVRAEHDRYSRTYILEEIVFSGEETPVTRYDLTEYINFQGLYTRASIENGELVEVTPSPFSDFRGVDEPFIEEPDEYRRERGKRLFHEFARVMRDKAKGQ